MKTRWWKMGHQLWGARGFLQSLFLRNKKGFINPFLSAAKSSSADSEKPIKFSTSKAAKWKAHYTHSGESTNYPPDSQPYVVMTSVVVFLIYFCILREENDLDDALRATETGMPIQVEEASIKVAIDYKKRLGEDTTALENRLTEIVKMK